MSEAYSRQRNQACFVKTKELVRQLPPICSKFIQSLENVTQPLTRMNYAYDLRVFYLYLANYEYSPLVMENGGKQLKPQDITIEMISSLTIGDLQDYLSYLDDYTSESADQSVHAPRSNSLQGKKRKIASLRRFFKFLYNNEYISENVATKLDTPKIHEMPIIRLEKSEINSIIEIVENGTGLTPAELKYHEKTKKRDIAVIVLLLTTGIRVSELVGLDVKDIDRESNAFSIIRKGGDKVILYFGNFTAKYLYDYLDLTSAFRTADSPVFLSMQNKRISVRAVENLVKKYARLASPLKKITPHKLRATYGTTLYNDTGDIYLVAEVLGHKDINTTRRHYAAISEAMRKSAVEKLSLNREYDDQTAKTDED